MTKQELNRDIKRFKKVFDSMEPVDFDEARQEFNRLYWADRTFEYMTRANILFMFRINIRYVFVELHHFGNQIQL
jgi:hypothetical protein